MAESLDIDPPGRVDESFRELFDKSAKIIHKEEDFERAHKALKKYFNHLENGNSRAVYQVPSDVSEVDRPLVVKFALPVVGNTGTEEALYAVEYTEGWMSNWHEIILSRYGPIEDLLVPTIDHHEDGLWTVMPFAETPPNSTEVMTQLQPLSERIEQADVECVTHGQRTNRPEIYQIKAWGVYQNEYCLRDYGGIVVTDEEYQNKLPSPFSDPRI